MTKKKPPRPVDWDTINDLWDNAPALPVKPQQPDQAPGMTQ